MRYGIFIETTPGSGTAHGHWAGPVVGPGIGGPLGPATEATEGTPAPARLLRAMDDPADGDDWLRLVTEALVPDGDSTRCTLTGYIASGPGQIAGGALTWAEPVTDNVAVALALLGPANTVRQPRQLAALLRPLS